MLESLDDIGGSNPFVIFVISYYVSIVHHSFNIPEIIYQQLRFQTPIKYIP